MSKKMIAAAAFLAALACGHAVQAAGPAGFARSFVASPAHELSVADARSTPRAEPVAAPSLTPAKALELMRVNSAVNSAVASLDGYLDGFASDLAIAGDRGPCVDCAELKRERLVALGWRKQTMRIAYALSETGRIQRVLVVTTDRGDIVLGEALRRVRGSHGQPTRPADGVAKMDARASAAFYDI
ncbi:MAG TPA: transglutaminase-like cysteine peptidase [Pseudorhizobium sp.]|nr:transglutaminase-like cysteine peptidase [Pseudorhizobium sp.]